MEGRACSHFQPWAYSSRRFHFPSHRFIPSLITRCSDLLFILVSTPSSPLSKHGHKLLLLSPIVEGLLGGYSTLQSATSAYLSDCTSSGSRAHIFSRFTGVVYLGFSIGPVIGAWLIRHPIAWVGGSSMPGRQSVTSVFWVAAFCSFTNFLLMIFVFPESLDKEKKERAMIAYRKSSGKKGKARERALTFSSGDPGNPSTDEEDNIEEVNRPRREERESGYEVRPGGTGIIRRLLSPLAVFLPVVVLDPSGLGRKKRDWSLTLLAGGLFAYMLSTVSVFFLRIISF
jgi:MFS family permease